MIRLHGTRNASAHAVDGEQLYTAGMRFAYALCLLLIQCLPVGVSAQTISGRTVLLVASRQLEDPNFTQTVVLVTRHGRSPPIGVIINKPLEVDLGKLFPTLPEAEKHRLHLGGPVDPEQLIFVYRGSRSDGTIEVADGVFVGRNPSLLAELLRGTRPHDGLRVFAGFAGWGQDQLEDEIRRGAWHVLPVDAKTLFDLPAADMWPTLLRRATQVMAVPGRLFDAPLAVATTPN